MVIGFQPHISGSGGIPLNQPEVEESFSHQPIFGMVNIDILIH
jgi:hypothetical protein